MELTFAGVLRGLGKSHDETPTERPASLVGPAQGEAASHGQRSEDDPARAVTVAVPTRDLAR